MILLVDTVLGAALSVGKALDMLLFVGGSDTGCGVLHWNSNGCRAISISGTLTSTIRGRSIMSSVGSSAIRGGDVRGSTVGSNTT